jgi:hypothetical protein
MLCGRLIYLNTVQVHKEHFSKCGAGGTIDSLRQSVFTYIDGYKDKNGGGGAAASNFIGDVFAYLLDVAEPTLKAHPNAFKFLKTNVDTSRKQITCTNCTVPAAPTRPGGTVPIGNCCKASLHQMFDFAHQVTKTYYGAYSSYSRSVPPAVTFDTKLYRNSIHDLPIKCSVSGAVRFPPSHHGACSEVQLLLHIDDFDPDSYLTVPYVLFHECIAHIYQGILPTPVNRQVNDPDDEFAEGWMDFVAFKIFEELYNGKGPAKGLLSQMNITQEHHHRSYNLHFSRIELNVEPPNRQSIYAIRRRSGHEAAGKVLRVLERLCQSETQAWETFLRISFDMNLSQKFERLQKQFFVAIINNLSRPGAIDSPHHCDIVRVIHKYLEHKDLVKFVAEILGLRALWAKKSPVSPQKMRIIH